VDMIGFERIFMSRAAVKLLSVRCVAHLYDYYPIEQAGVEKLFF